MTRNNFVFRILQNAALTLVVLVPYAEANAPDGRYDLSTTGVVLDTRTGLHWQRSSEPANHTWADAQAYCANLELQGSNWRLPSLKELVTLVDYSRTKPAIDTTAFPETNLGHYWSSTPFAGNSDVWSIDFQGGIREGKSGSNQYDVRCVR